MISSSGSQSGSFFGTTIGTLTPFCPDVEGKGTTSGILDRLVSLSLATGVEFSVEASLGVSCEEPEAPFLPFFPFSLFPLKRDFIPGLRY